MPISSLQLQEKDLSHAEKQSVWSRSRGQWSPRFVTIQCLCSQLCYVTAANQWTIVEIELFSNSGLKCGCQPFSCWCSQTVTHCRKEICLRNPFLPFLLGIPSIHALAEASSRERQHAPPVLHGGCKRSHPFVAAAEKACLMQRNRGFGHGVVVAANQWRTVEIVLLATVGWKWSCQPCSCRVWQNETHCRKEICSICFLKKSIPAIPFRNSKHPLPGRSNFLTAAARSTLFALWLHHAHLFVAAAGKKPVSCREAKRLVTQSWSVVSKICYSAVIVLSVVQCDCCKPWTHVEIELLATVSWKWGCQPFSCPCSQNVTRCRKEVYATCLSKESMPFVKSKLPLHTRSLRSLRAAARSTSSLHHASFWNSNHPLPTKSFRFPRSAVRSSICAVWFHHARPFVTAAKKACLMQLMHRSRAFGHGVVVSKICYNTVIVLSVVLCDCCKP